MKKNKICTTLALLLGILVFHLSTFDLPKAYAKPNAQKEKEIREAIKPYEELIFKEFYKKINTGPLVDIVVNESNQNTTAEKAVRNFVKKINDPYTEFFSLAELQSFNSSMEGEFYGIGVLTSKKDKKSGITILEVFDNSPAKEAGIKAKDVIIEVAEKKVTNMELQDAIKLIKGAKGTKVKIVLLRGKKKKVFNVERREVVFPSVKAKYYKKNKVGYLAVSSFNENTDEQFAEKLSALEKNDLKGLVIDLRDNGGGYVDTAQNMLDRILPDDKLLFTFEHKGGKREDFYSGENRQEKDLVFERSIVILMNKYSASASEIFAGALKDHNIAKIVGEKSFGKGVAQSIYQPQTDLVKGAVKITTQKYYLPLGESIHKKGIEPNKLVKNKKDKRGNQIDSQLQEAFKLIK